MRTFREYDMPLSPDDYEAVIAERYELLADVDYDGINGDPDGGRPNWAMDRRAELLELLEATDNARSEQRHREQAKTIRREQWATRS